MNLVNSLMVTKMVESAVRIISVIPNRVFAALAFLSCILLPVICFGQTASPAPQEVVKSAGRLMALLWAMVFLIIVLLGGLMILRALRRARVRSLRQRSAPTDATDVWAMHKLPEELEREYRDPESNNEL